MLQTTLPGACVAAEAWTASNASIDAAGTITSSSCVNTTGNRASDAAFHRFQAERIYHAPAHAYGVGAARRTPDVIFTTLTPRILVDVPYADREFASDPDRMWRQEGHVAERKRALDLALAVRGR